MSDSEAAAVTAQDDLDAPSPEEAPIAQVQVEEEDVAYDEEPDEEQQIDGPAPLSSAEAHIEVLQQVAFYRPVVSCVGKQNCSKRARSTARSSNEPVLFRMPQNLLQQQRSTLSPKVKTWSLKNGSFQIFQTSGSLLHCSRCEHFLLLSMLLRTCWNSQ